MKENAYTTIHDIFTEDNMSALVNETTWLVANLQSFLDNVFNFDLLPARVISMRLKQFEKTVKNAYEKIDYYYDRNFKAK